MGTEQIKSRERGLMSCRRKLKGGTALVPPSLSQNVTKESLDRHSSYYPFRAARRSDPIAQFGSPGWSAVGPFGAHDNPNKGLKPFSNLLRRAIQRQAHHVRTGIMANGIARILEDDVGQVKLGAEQRLLIALGTGKDQSIRNEDGPPPPTRVA